MLVKSIPTNKDGNLEGYAYENGVWIVGYTKPQWIVEKQDMCKTQAEAIEAVRDCMNKIAKDRNWTARG